MRKLLLPLLAAGLTTHAHAQDYRPFRMGLTYQFSESVTPGDTTHTLRIIGRSRVGADSVFQFSPMVVSLNTGWSPGPCIAAGNYRQRSNNLFGAVLRVPVGGGSYLLEAQNGRSLLLRPWQATAQVWTAAPGLTAQVSQRTLGTVLGQADSLVTIDFSNGQRLRLSKHWGIVESPALVALLDGRYRSRQLSLTALPEAGLGTTLVGPRAVFDFQPGDIFLRYNVSEGYSGSTCGEDWERDSIMARTTIANGTAIEYTIWRRTLRQVYGSPSAPAGFCNNVPGTYLSPGGPATLVVSDTAVAGSDPLSNHFQPYSPASNGGYLALVAQRSTTYPGQMEQTVQHLFSCPSGDSATIGGILDNGARSVMTTGLGQTENEQWGIYGRDHRILLGYRKNGVTYGQLRSFRQLLPAATARPAATTAAFPNPFSNELTVKFELTHPQAVALELRDALGRVVLTQPATLVAAGARTLQLNTTTLPTGVYTAFLQPAASPVQVLKVVKR